MAELVVNFASGNLYLDIAANWDEPMSDPCVKQFNISLRQREILNLAAQGFTDKEIAVSLELSLGTIRTYWDRLREKTSAKSRTQVVIEVLRQEFVALAEHDRQMTIERDLLQQLVGSGSSLCSSCGTRAIVQVAEPVHLS